MSAPRKCCERIYEPLTSGSYYAQPGALQECSASVLRG